MPHGAAPSNPPVSTADAQLACIKKIPLKGCSSGTVLQAKLTNQNFTPAGFTPADAS